MSYAVLGLVIGLIAGYLRGGKITYVGNRTFRWWPVLLAGALLQILAQQEVVGDGYALLLASYVCLLAFALLNWRTVGMGIIAIGIATNFAVIAKNDGMPIRPDAIVDAGIANADEIDELESELWAKRHIETPEDDWMVLADIIPFPFPGYRQVLSFGDLVLMVGFADVLANLMLPVAPRRRFAHSRATA